MYTLKCRWPMILTAVSALVLNGCAAGPTSRYVDGKWNVSENICSSNPANPELGDMRSELRSYDTSNSSFERKVTFFHLDKTILDISQKFTSAGQTGRMDTFVNSDANEKADTIQIRHNRELNNLVRGQMVKFFENDPEIDGATATSFCLYRGQ